MSGRESVSPETDLVVTGLNVSYRLPDGRIVDAVRDVSLSIAPGESLALVGESGSGKSSVAMSIARLLPSSAMLTGSIGIGGTDVIALRGSALRRWWCHQLGVVVQDPARALNPTMRVGRQVAERCRALGASRRDAHRSAINQLARVGLDDPSVSQRYPHSLSGGQRQRVLLAIALAASPSLVILDEPTTALDADAEAGVLRLLRRLRAESGAAVLHVTHDLDLARANCDRVAVLHAGRLVESGRTATVFAARTQAPTRRLLDARPASQPVEGARDGRRRSSSPLVELRQVSKRFDSALALDRVSIGICDAEVVGLVGPTGSGKSTLARIAAGLIEPSDGEVVYRTASGAPEVGVRPGRPSLRMVFQHPAGSLNPRHRVRQVLQRALDRSGSGSSLESLLAECQLDPALLDRPTMSLSGGQQQRVAIARALAVNPALIVCDEPVTSLDAPARAAILDLLIALQRERRMAMLFISHDLAAVEHVADRVLELRHGRLVDDERALPVSGVAGLSAVAPSAGAVEFDVVGLGQIDPGGRVTQRETSVAVGMRGPGVHHPSSDDRP